MSGFRKKVKHWWLDISPFAGYSYKSNALRISYALILFLLSVGCGTLWFWMVEGFTLLEAFYMVVITISTVGYTEVEPLTKAGKIFTSIYILANIGIFAYALSAFTYYVIQGEIFKNMHISLIKKEIDKLNNHIILCGFGRYGREVADHFLVHQQSFVVIENDPEKIQRLQESDHKILYLEGDGTNDDLLLSAGIKRANSLIAALGEDSDNVFTVLTARQLNPTLNIISRAYHNKSMRKLRLAGADHVIMPEQIGGFYMATLVTKPNAVEFFSYITNERVSDIGFEEVTYDELPEHCKGKSIKNLAIRSETGTNIIGFQAADGHFIVNPNPETVLTPGCNFIVIGNADQLKRFRDDFKGGK